jgi:hypothetical protein
MKELPADLSCEKRKEKKSRNAGCCEGYKPVYEEEIESGREQD